MGRQDWETETIVPVAFAENSRGELRLQGGDGQISPQLTTGGGKPGQGQPCIAFDTYNQSVTGDTTQTLCSRGDSPGGNAHLVPAVAHAIQAGALRENPESGPDGVGVQANHAYTLEARAEVQAVQQGWAVRRLTPRECERLQGFPDGYTDVPWRNKNWTPDGPRYKALGNSMAVNAMRWIGRRIEMTADLTPAITPQENQP